MSDIYDGPATVRIGDDERTVRVRLAGHVDPIDGRYHWQGTVFDELPGGVKLPQQITRVGRRQPRAGAHRRAAAAGRLFGRRRRCPAVCRSDDLAVAGPVAVTLIAITSTTTATTPPATPEISSGSSPSSPQRNPAHNPAASTEKPLSPWNTPCALPWTPSATSDEIHALPTPSVHP